MIDDFAKPEGAEIDVEVRRWCEHSFVDVSARCSWSPLLVPENERKRRQDEAFRLGTLYALDVIRHLKHFSYCPDRLVDLLQDMVAAGRWTGVEHGFASALADHLVGRRVILSDDYEVTDLRRLD